MHLLVFSSVITVGFVDDLRRELCAFMGLSEPNCVITDLTWKAGKLLVSHLL